MVPSERYGEIVLKENEHGASVNVLPIIYLAIVFLYCILHLPTKNTDPALTLLLLLLLSHFSHVRLCATP